MMRQYLIDEPYFRKPCRRGPALIRMVKDNEGKIGQSMDVDWIE